MTTPTPSADVAGEQSDPRCFCCCRPLSEHDHKRQCPETTYFVAQPDALSATPAAIAQRYTIGMESSK